MAAVPQVPERGRERVQRLESVREHDHQSPSSRPIGQRVQEAAEGDFAAGLRLLQHLAEHREMAGGRPGRDQPAGLAAAGDQPDGVALADHQVGERRREPPRVLELRARPPRVPHAPRRIDDEVRFQICLFFIFLDVVAVALAERPPVDVADLVPRPVLAVLGELDREALERAPVHPRHHPLDHQPRHQLEPAEARQRRGVDRVAVDESIFHRHGPRHHLVSWPHIVDASDVASKRRPPSGCQRPWRSAGRPGDRGPRPPFILGLWAECGNFGGKGRALRPSRRRDSLISPTFDPPPAPLILRRLSSDPGMTLKPGPARRIHRPDMPDRDGEVGPGRIS